MMHKPCNQVYRWLVIEETLLREWEESIPELKNATVITTDGEKALKKWLSHFQEEIAMVSAYGGAEALWRKISYTGNWYWPPFNGFLSTPQQAKDKVGCSSFLIVFRDRGWGWSLVSWIGIKLARRFVPVELRKVQCQSCLSGETRVTTLAQSRYIQFPGCAEDW
jgi:hypothetical protein